MNSHIRQDVKVPPFDLPRNHAAQIVSDYFNDSTHLIETLLMGWHLSQRSPQVGQSVGLPVKSASHELDSVGKRMYQC